MTTPILSHKGEKSLDHLIARIRSTTGKRDQKFRKLLSDQKIYDLDDAKLAAIQESSVPYQPDHNLDEGTWFCIEQFSQKNYFLPWLGKPFSSTEYQLLTRAEAENIQYLCAYQSENLYCFQRVSKAQYLSKKKFITMGDQYEFQQDSPLLMISEQPDAIYVKDKDVLLFRSLATINSIFNGIDQLYKEATDEETRCFLKQDFIQLDKGFNVFRVSKPNRHRIAMATETLKKLKPKEMKRLPNYIQEYCPALTRSGDAFVITTDNDLKFVLYGIEQRYYTTQFTSERCIASSVLKI